MRPFPSSDPRPTCATGLASQDHRYCTESEFYNDRAHHGFNQFDLLIHRKGETVARFNGLSLQGWAAGGDLIVARGGGVFSIAREYLDALSIKD